MTPTSPEPPRTVLEMTRDEWLEAVERAAYVLCQHTYRGEMILAGTRRDDLLAVRNEDWQALNALLNP